MFDIQPFIEWQKQGNRSVKIEIGNAFNRDSLEIWVYDYDLGFGEIVESADKIDIKAALKRHLEEEAKRYEKIMEA